MHARWRLVAMALAWLLLAGAAPASAQRPTETLLEPADSGARILAIEELGPRTMDVIVDSPAVGEVLVRLLLPAGFDDATRVYPTLYLLHGGAGQYLDWSEQTAIEQLTEPHDLLVAMPSAASSYLGAWLREGGPDGRGGPPNWASFHVEELPQLLERNFRASSSRAIGGLSLGGWGAVMSAAQHPHRYEAVASFSGALDLDVPTDAFPPLAEPVQSARDIAAGQGWSEPNPIELVAGLESLAVYLSYGNGEPGPFDDPERGSDPVEAWIGEGNDGFAAALEAAGITAVVNDYGLGTHSWPYWERELELALPVLIEALEAE